MILLKWSKVDLLRAQNHKIFFNEKITFDATTFTKFNQIRGLRDVAVSGNIHYDIDHERVYADIHIEGIMIVPCSITLEDVDYPFETDSYEIFSFDKVEDDDVHEVKGDVVELLPVVFQLILLEVPLKVIKEGIIEYPKGNGWEVVKEEDYRAMKKDEIDPRLAKLKEFKLEE